MEKFYVVQFPDKHKKQVCMILKREEITWKKKIPLEVGAEIKVGKNGTKAMIVGKGDDQMQLLSLIGKKIGAGTGKAKASQQKRKGLRSDKGKEDESETNDESETKDESEADDDVPTGTKKKKDSEALTKTQKKSVKGLKKNGAPKVSDDELWEDEEEEPPSTEKQVSAKGKGLSQRSAAESHDDQKKSVKGLKKNEAPKVSDEELWEDEEEEPPSSKKQVSAKGKGLSQRSAAESHDDSDGEPREKRKPEVKQAEEAAEEKLDSELQEHEAVLKYVTKTKDHVRLVENGRLLILEIDYGELLKCKSKKSVLAMVSTAIRKCYKSGPHMIEYSAVGQKKKKLPFVADIIKFCRFIEDLLGVEEDDQTAAHLITTRINKTIGQMAKKDAE